MFNKPKFKIGESVFVVIERGGEAEVHKTTVENHVFELLKGWKVAVKKTWNNNSGYFMLSFGGESTPEVPVENVFSNEEDAKHRAEDYAEEIKEKNTKEQISKLEESIKETEAELEAKKKKLKKLL